MCASPSRAQHRGPANIPQETGNMGLVWSMAVSSHPCFSRLICRFHEIHSPLFSHFSPSLFIAGFIYMSRALLVLARQSVVAEQGAGEGISGKARSTLVPGQGHLLPWPPPPQHMGGRWAALHAKGMSWNQIELQIPQTHTNVLSLCLQGTALHFPWDAGHPGAGTFLPHVPSWSCSCSSVLLT